MNQRSPAAQFTDDACGIRTRCLYPVCVDLEEDLGSQMIEHLFVHQFTLDLEELPPVVVDSESESLRRTVRLGFVEAIAGCPDLIGRSKLVPSLPRHDSLDTECFGSLQ